MSVAVDNLSKTGQIETESKNSAQLDKGISGKEAADAGVFKALLSLLKSDTDSAQAGGLRNRPASSQIIGYGRNGFTTEHTLAGLPLNGQGVNTLAASALIALAAVSCGPNRLSGLCGQGAGMPAGMTGLVPGAAGVGATACDAGGIYPGQEIGALSAHFESGRGGPGSIGYDENGGTSYGTYQISSRAGTMKLFIDYLSRNAPDLAQKLQAAGPANTGSRSGKMPEVWKQLAAADPVRFEKLQTGFIRESLYLPTVQEISDKTGLDISKAPKALQEVLWSTAVQHGSKGAADIFIKAIGSVEGRNDQLGMAKLIDTVYDMRADRFASSSPGVRAAVASRLRHEGRIALAMLSDENANAGSVTG